MASDKLSVSPDDMGALLDARYELERDAQIEIAFLRCRLAEESADRKFNGWLAIAAIFAAVLAWLVRLP